ncbi:MAG: UbiA family prenyltransferase [Nitrospirota bacterium]|nr:MAG: UbiA family prenyltransferase [Nitrospirota bacterium]
MYGRILTYLSMIKFSHSVFALPFALTAAFLAANGSPTLWQVFWIVVAMISARSAAMGMNRVIDREIDAVNPRTMDREIPSGKVQLHDAITFVVISFGIMVFSAYMLNTLSFYLSPVAIAVLVFYSYTKRFTFLSHLVLGIAIAGAPLGAWIAITGSIDVQIMPLVFAVVFWLAGFDILYALQDMEFDRSHGLYSVPQRFGTENSLIISRIAHLFTWLLLLITGCIFNTGVIYFAGIAVVGVILFYEHALVRKDDLSKLDIAFFNMNGYISMTVFVFTLIETVF